MGWLEFVTYILNVGLGNIIKHAGCVRVWVDNLIYIMVYITDNLISVINYVEFCIGLMTKQI